MDEITKRTIKKTILRLRRLLEKEDIPAILKQHGIFPDGRRVPTEKIVLLDDAGKSRRDRLEATIERETRSAGNDPEAGVRRYCREVAFTYLNRLIALRCMEMRALIDECIKTREDYAGRSLRHHRFRREYPEARFDAEDVDGLKAFLCFVFGELQNDIKILFDPDDEYSIIMPSLTTLTECIRALNEDITADAFKEPELIGWVYQYFQTEEKNRVFEEVRTKKKKIEGDDIVPATSLYTERYMVDYLVQNSLGLIWMEMYPDSKLCEKWPYFVKNQDRRPRKPSSIKSLTFLDPACGSGHFLLIGFDLLIQMYQEEARLAEEAKVPKEWVVPKEKIAATIIESNLHGIDIDLRSVQLSWLVLYLKMREHQNSVDAAKSLPKKVNLVAADASLLDAPDFLLWCEERFKGEPYVLNIIKGVAKRLYGLSEIGSLARPEEDLKELIKREKERLLSVWKREKQSGQTLLFQEFLTPEQQELPFEKVTDAQFWDGLTRRLSRILDVFLKRTRQEMRERLFATDLQRVIIFLDLCRKRYDVVATNPPYMGSKNMGKELKEYVQRAYPEGKRDLYAAFIMRNREWTKERGIVSMVTQQSWMFLRSFVKMRERILKEDCIQTLAHLGEHAFVDSAAAGAFVVLFTLANEKSREGHRPICIKVTATSSPHEKNSMLRREIRLGPGEVSFTPRQDDFLVMPRFSLCYWLQGKFMQLLTVGRRRLSMDVVEPSTTGDNERFFRYRWETSNCARWFPSSKGGGYSKWCGFDSFLIDWENKGQRMKSFPGSYVRNEQYMFRCGLTFSQMTRGSLSVRSLPRNGTFGKAGPGIFPRGMSDKVALAILNSRLISYLLRAINTKLTFSTGSLLALPAPICGNADLETLVEHCVVLKKCLLSSELIEYEFENGIATAASKVSVTKAYGRYAGKKLLCASLLHSVESVLEEIILSLYEIGENEVAIIADELGTPAGWHSLIAGCDAIPETGGTYPTIDIPKEVVQCLQNHQRVDPSPEEFSQIKSYLRALYEAGPGARVEDVIQEKEMETSGNEDESEALIGKRIPIPTETFLEELSVKTEIHPISIYWLLKEMREKERVVCWPECKQYVEDYFTVMILRMLGFRWPKQIEANEPIPDWTDKDGIVPITDHTSEKTLLERIRDCIGAEFGEDGIGTIETEFADILYNADCKDAEVKDKRPPRKKTTLANWLEREFFKKHTSQFKKRSIAWHVTSSSGTFQVLLFYHRLSRDILKNLKNRYLARVQSYYGVLLERARSEESVSGDLTTGKLQDIEVELEDFAAKLDEVINLPYEPLIDDGVRVNIAPLQKVGLLKHPVLATKDVERAIADRNRWREDDKEQNTVWRM